MVKKIYFATSLLLLLALSSFAQNFKSTTLNNPQRLQNFSQYFSEYKIYELDLNLIKKSLATRGNRHQFNLNFDNHQWQLDLFGFEALTPDYQLLVGTDEGVKKFGRNKNLQFFKGYNRNSPGSKAFMTISDNFLLLSVEENGNTYFVEKARLSDPLSSDSEFIFYNTNDVKKNPAVSCGYDFYKAQMDQFKENHNELNNRNHCVTVEAALAMDLTIFQWQGNNSGAAEAWATGILALVETNYDNEFAHGVQMAASATYVATTTSSDPWNGVNNINTHLDVHLSWGNGGGYNGASYDFATAWTRKYTSGAVGLAWVGVVCTSNRYNVCSAFSTTSNTNRQLQAHEVGHNFSAGHDASGSSTIMAPAVNGSSTWSSASISAISGHIASRWCLDICSSGSAPTAAFSGSPTIGCAPLRVTFRDLSTGNPTSWLWSFPGGTPSTSTQQNPVVTYNAGGIYDVTLEVRNASGDDVVTQNQYIYVYDPVIAFFDEIIDLRHVFFNNQSSNGDTYKWDFGDGEMSTDENPEHEYNRDGTFTVKLTVTNFCGSKTYTKRITIATPPIANFEADTTLGCASFTVRFKNLSSNNVVRYEWSFPGGNPSFSTQLNPTVTYNYADSFTVKLKVSNAAYDHTFTRSKYIVVDTVPTAKFDELITGLNVDFFNQSIRGKNYNWSFGDGTTSKDANPNYTYGQSGTYNVRLIVDNKCGKDTLDKTITVSAGLFAAFNANTRIGCAPMQVQYQNQSQGANSFKWTFPGGNPSSSTSPNPLVSYDQAGTYDVTLEVTDGIDTKVSTQTGYIKVNQNPISAYNYAISGLSVNFTNQSQFGNSYAWDFGDGKQSTEPNPSHTFASEGEFKVILSVTNECGTVSITKDVIVYLIPKVSFTSDTTLVCAGSFVQFKDLSSKDVNDWSWQFSGAIPALSTEQNPKVVYWKAGTYSVKLVVKNTNGSNTLTKTNYIKVLSPIKCPKANKEYSEGNDEDPFNKLNPRSSTTPAKPWTIVPNPSEGMFVLNFEQSPNSQYRVRVFNMQGSLVYQRTISNPEQSVRFDLSALSKGSYFIQLSNEVENQTTKLIIQ